MVDSYFTSLLRDNVDFGYLFLTGPYSYGITDLRTKSQIYPQVVDVCSSGGQLIGEDVSGLTRVSRVDCISDKYLPKSETKRSLN
jgi:hypothetical protein